MNYKTVYEHVNKEFGHDVALLTSNMVAVHLSTYPVAEEFYTHGLYETRLIKLFKDTFWEENQEDFDLAFKCWGVLHDWSIGQSLAGLGGCTKKTFKELIERNPCNTL